jgi:hypothetical protein
LYFDRHAEPARAKRFRAGQLASAQLLGGRERDKHRGWRRRASPALFIEWEQLDAQCALADFAEHKLRILSGETDG